MNDTGHIPRKFGGVLMTDQRGPDEAVMVMRLTPAPDEESALDFCGCLIIAALHMKRGPAGLLFDISSSPSVSNASGKPLPLLESIRLTDAMRRALDKLRVHLRTRSGQGTMPAAIVDQLRFFVFEKGDARVTLDWRVEFAGKSYPLQQPGLR